MSAITQLQSISEPVVHRVAPIYRALMATFDLNPNNIDFRAECLHGDELLIKFYQQRTNLTKRPVKKSITAAMLAGRKQLRKNFGVIERAVVDRSVEPPFIVDLDKKLTHRDRVCMEDAAAREGADDQATEQRWTLNPWKTDADFESQEYVVGDSSGKDSMLFYWIAELADVYAKDDYALKPSRDMFYHCVPWDYTEAEWNTLYTQLCGYIDARLCDLNVPAVKPDDGFDLFLMWRSLGRTAAYKELGAFFVRMLEVPGSSAQAERSISAYNHIVKDKRLRLSKEHIKSYVMIYANGNIRQERARKRREYSKKKRRKEFFLDQQTFSPEHKSAKTARLKNC